MISDEQARQFAEEWIEAWNAHDLDAILAHYAEDVEFFSPVVVQLTGIPTGRLNGKEAVRSYFGKGLETHPGLHFELLDVLVGMGSVVLSYRSIGGRLAAEVMELDDERHAVRVLCHYTEPRPA
jgi:ketosteroid isomerase-like protein